MTVIDSSTVEFLLQRDIIEDLLPRIGTQQWQPLYLDRDQRPHSFGLWCALLDEDAAARALERDSWDLMMGHGRPGFSQSWANGETVTTYHRFGGDEGIRPLVLYREFAGAFPAYFEIDEEFRLYHDLAEDRNRGLLLDLDSSGREIEVVRMADTEILARLKYLRQFQAGLGLYLAIYIDSVRYSKLKLGEVPVDETRWQLQDSTNRWSLHISECNFVREYATFSRLLGKRLIPPPPQSEAGIRPFEGRDDREVTFIIGTDENGEPIEYTSNPDELANYFGANPGAPHYLKPVFFRREVLSKYYAEPERYTISDGLLSCLGLWSCRIDNDLKDYMVVFLGDLGRDLPYEERLHWRQFNMPPEGGVSETNFRRSFLAQFADSQASDLVFRREYRSLAEDWEREFGWLLFLPLTVGDAHLLDTIRIPVTNSQAEMDEQVLHLAKLMVDSLNEKEIAARAGKLEKGAKGISKVSGFFGETGFPAAKGVVQLLRDLQQLRSTGSGHRKGSEYEAVVARLGIDPLHKPEAVAKLLGDAASALLAMREFYIPDEGRDG